MFLLFAINHIVHPEKVVCVTKKKKIKCTKLNIHIFYRQQDKPHNIFLAKSIKLSKDASSIFQI